MDDGGSTLRAFFPTATRSSRPAQPVRRQDPMTGLPVARRAYERLEPQTTPELAALRWVSPTAALVSVQARPTGSPARRR
ncbi:MAG: hypothetical protein ACLS6O_00200 [Bifidobacterium sp.]